MLAFLPSHEAALWDAQPASDCSLPLLQLFCLWHSASSLSFLVVLEGAVPEFSCPSALGWHLVYRFRTSMAEYSHKCPCSASLSSALQAEDPSSVDCPQRHLKSTKLPIKLSRPSLFTLLYNLLHSTFTIIYPVTATTMHVAAESRRKEASLHLPLPPNTKFCWSYSLKSNHSSLSFHSFDSHLSLTLPLPNVFFMSSPT